MPAGLLPLLTLLIFVVIMDSRVMTMMLPEIADDLDSSISAAGFALTAYLLAYGTSNSRTGLSQTGSGRYG